METKLVFVTEKGPEPFDSLSVQLHAVLSTKFEQPVLSANYYSIDLKAAKDGGLVDGTNLELRFKDRGMLDFVGSMEKAREAAVYKKRNDLLAVDDLRECPWCLFLSGANSSLISALYTSPASGSRVALSSSSGAPPTDDAPPGYEA
jgi:hypothetical protein